MSRLAAGAAIVLLMPLSLGAAGEALPTDSFTVSNFKLRDYATGGELNWQLNGEEAIASGRRVRIRKLKGSVYVNGERYLILSPACEFDKYRKVAHSDEPVHVRSETLLIDGIGFDLDLEQRQITIRQQVRVRIFSTPVNLLGK